MKIQRSTKGEFGWKKKRGCWIDYWGEKYILSFFCFFVGAGRGMIWPRLLQRETGCYFLFPISCFQFHRDIFLATDWHRFLWFMIRRGFAPRRREEARRKRKGLGFLPQSSQSGTEVLFFDNFFSHRLTQIKFYHEEREGWNVKNALAELTLLTGQIRLPLLEASFCASHPDLPGQPAAGRDFLRFFWHWFARIGIGLFVFLTGQKGKMATIHHEETKMHEGKRRT